MASVLILRRFVMENYRCCHHPCDEFEFVVVVVIIFEIIIKLEDYRIRSSRKPISNPKTEKFEFEFVEAIVVVVIIFIVVVVVVVIIAIVLMMEVLSKTVGLYKVPMLRNLNLLLLLLSLSSLLTSSSSS